MWAARGRQGPMGFGGDAFDVGGAAVGALVKRLNQRKSDFVASSATLEDCYAKGSHSILREIARKSHLKSGAFTWRRKSPATDKTALNKVRSVIRSSAGTNDRPRS